MGSRYVVARRAREQGQTEPQIVQKPWWHSCEYVPGPAGPGVLAVRILAGAPVRTATTSRVSRGPRGCGSG
jgi:hypothetical protein